MHHRGDQKSTLISKQRGGSVSKITEYVGNDGLLYCSKCHKPTQTRKRLFGCEEERVIRINCDCLTELEFFRMRQRQDEIARNKKICFAETNMTNWNFENDDRKNPRISDAMKKYVENFPEFMKEGKGLLLLGPVGTGKSYYAACIANALIDAGYTALMTNFAKIINRLQGSFDGRQEFINSLNKYSILIIDDLGAERNTEYTAEQIFNIIDNRYRSNKPMIITTNLTDKQLQSTDDITRTRIYDRILEKCIPIKVDGASRRKQNLVYNLFEEKRKLGL